MAKMISTNIIVQALVSLSNSRLNITGNYDCLYHGSVEFLILIGQKVLTNFLGLGAALTVLPAVIEIIDSY